MNSQLLNWCRGACLESSCFPVGPGDLTSRALHLKKKQRNTFVPAAVLFVQRFLLFPSWHAMVMGNGCVKKLLSSG